MRIIAHTQYGVFEGKHGEATEEEFNSMQTFLRDNLYQSPYFKFMLANGSVVFLTKEMIANSLFILER